MVVAARTGAAPIVLHHLLMMGLVPAAVVRASTILGRIGASGATSMVGVLAVATSVMVTAAVAVAARMVSALAVVVASVLPALIAVATAVAAAEVAATPAVAAPRGLAVVLVLVAPVGSA